MAINLIPAFALLAICVAIHATGLSLLLRWMEKRTQHGKRTMWKDIWLLVRVSWIIVALHTLQIIIFAIFYLDVGSMPDIHTAFYFSAVTYTTVGYGDILIPEAWRGLAGAEALTGILMTGLSTGFFFMILSRVFIHTNRSKDQE
ncbi:MAG: ion channel [Flavobacteriales bacterium]